MTKRRVSLVVFLVLCALCVIHALYFYPQLPDKVASHFGPSGQPDAWSSKASFVTFYMIVAGVLAILFLGISFGMSKIPLSLINLPNKDYWLSPDRKRETFDFIFHYFLWFASATFVLLIAMFHQSFRVHLGKAKSLEYPMLSVGIYIVFTILWCIGLYVKFCKKKELQPSDSPDSE